MASNSKVINALINAVRNGKEVVVMLELRARFDEEANLEWKERLEEEGVKVLIGVDNIKVHAKICIIKKSVMATRYIQYGFVSTGNLNEQTATCIWRPLPANQQQQCNGRHKPDFQLPGKSQKPVLNRLNFAKP